jgi:hypothetical protein
MLSRCKVIVQSISFERIVMLFLVQCNIRNNRHLIDSMILISPFPKGENFKYKISIINSIWETGTWTKNKTLNFVQRPFSTNEEGPLFENLGSNFLHIGNSFGFWSCFHVTFCYLNWLHTDLSLIYYTATNLVAMLIKIGLKNAVLPTLLTILHNIAISDLRFNNICSILLTVWHWQPWTIQCNTKLFIPVQ